ncbi:NRDE family protein [Halalkalibacter okhensis]|uniref:NRDE family protein n=1 Tax=Halalkalibacter okhensis TaxID=333138 RepID=A0A0B0ICH3_9BACI|nr:NRDE family protein [Halalkalibacter okhensis]KHF40273.1 hypothetical protein LQ50_09730 [Halalkalibacter okhensis]
MCLLSVGLHVHPDYDLILVSNRDEFFERKTKRAHIWQENPDVVAGKDLELGGTWLGVTKTGRLAGVTNVREPFKQERMKSRGVLVTDFLFTHDEPERYVKKVLKEKDQYQGFNLITGSGDQWIYTSNRSLMENLDKGIHVISNAGLNTEWPKTRKLKQKFEYVLNEPFTEEQLINKCMDILQDDELARDDQLPNTGVTLELERMLSPIFIKGTEYGTRASTVILFKRGTIRFIEQAYGPNGKIRDKVDISFEVLKK